MDTVFPFGFPPPTAWYLAIYLGTFLIHALFMNYVLAGSAVLAVGAVTRRDTGQVSAILRDWMPFMLSGAITAGVGPLLFLQILYTKEFYTANLLLFYRWMAILPVLLVGFYLAYLVKSRMVRDWPLVARVAVGCGPFACFAFIGWSWVENHLLSVHSEVWIQQFEAGALVFWSPELVPRLGLWFVAAFPTLALVLGWQLWYGQDRKPVSAEAVRTTCLTALGGLAVVGVVAGIYFNVMNEASRGAVFGPVARPYFVLWMVGSVVQAVAWAGQLKAGCLTRSWLVGASLGLAASFLGMAVIREATRLGILDLPTLYLRHQKATEVGGLVAFLVFLVVNLALLSYCIHLVRSGGREPEPSQ